MLPAARMRESLLLQKCQRCASLRRVLDRAMMWFPFVLFCHCCSDERPDPSGLCAPGKEKFFFDFQNLCQRSWAVSDILFSSTPFDASRTDFHNDLSPSDHRRNLRFPNQTRGGCGIVRYASIILFVPFLLKIHRNGKHGHSTVSLHAECTFRNVISSYLSYGHFRFASSSASVRSGSQ